MGGLTPSARVVLRCNSQVRTHQGLVAASPNALPGEGLPHSMERGSLTPCLWMGVGTLALPLLVSYCLVPPTPLPGRQ